MSFLRYVFVQLVAYVLDMGGFILMFEFGDTDPIIANIFGKVTAGLFAFFAHRNVTFDNAREGKTARQAGLYFLLLAINVPVSSAVFGVLLWIVPQPIAAKLMSDILCVALSYWLSRTYVFAKPTNNLSNTISQRASDT